MLITESQQRLRVQRYRKERGEITTMNRVRLLKNQGKRDPEVIPTDWSLTGEKLVSLNLETRRQEKDRDLSEDLGQGR